MESISSFGEMLKAFRVRKRLTQQGLAARIGVHRNTISIWERGSYLPESKTLVLEVAHQLSLHEQETRQLLEASLTALSPRWYLPYPRNPFFTGREEVLQALHQALHADQPVALTQSYALHGLGGIGKTQIAVEYAYRYTQNYAAIFWIKAETAESIGSSFLRMAELLQLPEQGESDQSRVVAAVQRWLSNHRQWLLIWDNMEDLELLQRWLPPARQGAILLTTRCQALGTLAQGVELTPMGQEEGMLFVLRRAKLLGSAAPIEQMHQLADSMPGEYAAAAKLVAVMDGLPLALDQAGSYIEETGCSPTDYLQRYEQQQVRLLDRRGGPASDHPQSVAATFALALERVEREQHVAADVLRVCAMLHAEAIPEEVFVEGAAHLGPALEPLAADPSQFDQAIAVLRRLSLVQCHTETHTLSIHRLVQAVLRGRMDEQEQALWLQRVIAALNAVFPEVTYEPWRQRERLLPHVLACVAALPDQAGGQELVGVLRKAADYLRMRAQYEQAEPLYQRALRIGERALGADHLEVIRLLTGLASLFYTRGKYERAEQLFLRALHTGEQALGVEHLEIAHPLNGLATLYWKQGKYEQAEALYRRALRTREQALGSEHPEVIYPLTGLAILFEEQGKYEQTEPLYQRALRIWEQAWGPEHPDVATSLNNLAILYAKQGKYEQAEPLFQRALHIWELAWGPEHPDVATSLHNLAFLYFEQKKYEQAEPLFQRALHFRELALGPGHPFVASSLDGLANLYLSQEKYEQAEPLFQRALHIREQMLGPEHPDTARSLADLAVLCAKQGKREQAEPLFLQALTIFEQRLGREHPDTVKVMECYSSLGRDVS